MQLPATLHAHPEIVIIVTISKKLRSVPQRADRGLIETLISAKGAKAHNRSLYTYPRPISGGWSTRRLVLQSLVMHKPLLVRKMLRVIPVPESKDFQAAGSFSKEEWPA